jgi:hypothetical protein
MFVSRTPWLAVIFAVCSVSAAPAADDLAATVAGRLRDSGALSGYRVNVKAKQGTVWLEGRVSDPRQLAAAMEIAEGIPGVERVVNRLVIENPTPPRTEAAAPFALPSNSLPSNAPPAAAQAFAVAKAGSAKAASAAQAAPRTAAPGRPPLPLAAVNGRPVPRAGAGVAPRGVRPVSGGEPMMLPGPGGYDGSYVDGQMVPGTMRMSDGGPGYPGGPGGFAGGQPMPMGGTGRMGGTGMPPIPMRGDGPNMPNYAWPSYAAYPNYAALQYPTQYSPTAWPYIGPFYPYPQVPLGWRRVSLEWDDGWWWLDFDERHIHSHHR